MKPVEHTVTPAEEGIDDGAAFQGLSLPSWVDAIRNPEETPLCVRWRFAEEELAAMNGGEDPVKLILQAGLDCRVNPFMIPEREIIRSVSIYSETAPLEAAVVGRADTLVSANSFRAICKTIERSIRNGELPDFSRFHDLPKHERAEFEARLAEIRSEVESELESFCSLLRSHGVAVYRPLGMHAQEQMFARDPFFVIGDKVVFSKMGTPEREIESYGVAPLFRSIPRENVIFAPKEVEGGDVAVHNGKIWVGVNGSRSSREVIPFFESNFPDFEVVPVPLVHHNRDGEDVLHKDCTLNFAGKESVVVYPQGLLDAQRFTRDELREYKVHNAPHDEQLILGVNFFSLAPDKVLSDPDTPRINEMLSNDGIEVLELPAHKLRMWGGKDRCAINAVRRGLR